MNFLKKSADFGHFWKFDVFAKNGKKYFSQMGLKADFWHDKVKTYLVSYKLFKFYAKPKKSADLGKFSKMTKWQILKKNQITWFFGLGIKFEKFIWN